MPDTRVSPYPREEVFGFLLGKVVPLGVVLQAVHAFAFCSSIRLVVLPVSFHRMPSVCEYTAILRPSFTLA